MYNVVCLYIGVLMCMHMSTYVCGVIICVCFYVCVGADVAWMMGLESWWCRAAVRTWTEPVDVVLVVTGRVMYVYGVVVVVVLGGIIYDSVDGSG